MNTPTPPADPERVERVLGRDDVLDYAHLTDDFNPIHVDEDFAAQSPFGQTIVHGTLTLTLVWDLLARLEGGQSLTGTTVSVRFTAPVAVGETVTAVVEDAADTDATLRLAVRRTDGTAALTADVYQS